jgi:hypothetical protein
MPVGDEMKKIACCLALLCSAFSSQAQNITNADEATAQATVRRDEEGFASCGVRAIVQVIQPKEIEAFDFSLTVDAVTLRGLLKAGKYSIPWTGKAGWAFEKKRTVLPAPVDFWIADQAADLPAKKIQSMKSDNEGFLLELAEFLPTQNALAAIAEGRRVQFAVRYPSERFDRVISFKVAMKEEDINAMTDCYNGMQRRMQRLIDAK